MTIDEAIRHCEEVAEQQEANSFIDRWSDDDEWNESLKENCRQCAADHRQLAEWLRELQEAKRLLKLAVEDFELYGSLKDLKLGERIKNPRYRDFRRIFDILDNTWRYADEAKELLGEKI